MNIVSKNNIGVVTALLLVILLSQTKVFNFLLDTALGRMFLILFILVISYTNKILGVVSVLFIIIMFNNSSIARREGFTDPSQDNLMSTTDKKAEEEEKSEEEKDKVQQNIETNNNTSTSIPIVATSTTTEGFDLIGTENNIKRGKPSNSIPVSGFMRESANVSPYENSNFAKSYTEI